MEEKKNATGALVAKQIVRLFEVKSLVTLALTWGMLALLMGKVQVAPEVLALYSTAYGSVTTYFFTRKDAVVNPNTEEGMR